MKYEHSEPAILLKVITEQQITIDKLTHNIEKLQYRIEQLLHLLFGSKKEKRKLKYVCHSCQKIKMAPLPL